MMKRNKSLTGRSGLFGSALAFMAIMFGFSSCRPDFDLDKRFPEWLGTSIYETLDEGFDGRTFKYFVRLIDALDNQKSILSKTGSRTLFVADDEAFQRFLDKCPLAGNKAIRFEDLSKAQLKMILKGSMLNNVYQVASLSSTSTENGVRLGDCMRRVATVSEYDSVRVLLPEDMPKNSHWNYLRNNPKRQGKGIIIMEDGTKKPMIFFAPEFLKNRKIEDDDYNFLFNIGKFSRGGVNKDGRAPNDASVNGVKIVIQNKKCFNGFIHVMEDVVYELPSMAEYLAQVDENGNSESKIYSSILERFSAPFYLKNNQACDNDHTGTANTLKIRQLVDDDYYGSAGIAIENALGASGRDSVFTKLYFSGRFQSAYNSQGVDSLLTNPKGRKIESSSVLKFDPGWNSYFVSSTSGNDIALQEDMAAMFVPTDAAIMDWWINNAQGQEMRGRYGILTSDPTTWTVDSVVKDMSNIDLNVIVKLVNNSMFVSLCNTVPSKFSNVLNDAQDRFFTDPGTAVDLFEKVVMCCNGAIFFSNQVFVPTSYKAVSYPALVNSKLKVMNWAIEDKTMQFSYYLNSMATAYALFLPEVNLTDANPNGKLFDKLVWVDPASFALNKLGSEEDSDESADYTNENDLVALAFYYDDDAETIKADVYEYDAAADTIGALINTSGSITNLDYLRNRMKDILDYHIILLSDKNYSAMEGGDPKKLHVTPDVNGNAYFRTKGGGVVRFNYGSFSAEDNPDLSQLKVAGGWQIEKGQSVNMVKRFNMRDVDGNGIAYVIDRPIQTSRKSVYDILSDTLTYPEFEEFFKLMDDARDSDNKRLFDDVYDDMSIGSKKCVTEFNTYNYTIYVPSNDSIKALLKKNIIYDPNLLEDWDTTYMNIWTKLQDEYYESPDVCDAAWKDSIKKFYTDYYHKDIMTTADSVLLKYTVYNKADYSDYIEYDLPYKTFKEQFINVKRNQLVNFLKYHIQDNSVYTNAEFNRGNAQYATAYLNEKKQYAKLYVTVDENISIVDEVGHTRNVEKKYKNGVAYWNIMCREYVFKRYNSSYSEATADDVNDVQTTKLETTSYAVIHLIDGALCNGEVIF